MFVISFSASTRGAIDMIIITVKSSMFLMYLPNLITSILGLNSSYHKWSETESTELSTPLLSLRRVSRGLVSPHPRKDTIDFIVAGFPSSSLILTPVTAGGFFEVGL